MSNDSMYYRPLLDVVVEGRRNSCVQGGSVHAQAGSISVEEEEEEETLRSCISDSVRSDSLRISQHTVDSQLLHNRQLVLYWLMG